MCWLPTIKQAFQIFGGGDTQVRINPGLTATTSDAEPSQARIVDVHRPIVAIGVRPQDVRVFRILARVWWYTGWIERQPSEVILLSVRTITNDAVVAATINADHERPILGDGDRVANICSGIDEELTRLRALDRHALH